MCHSFVLYHFLSGHRALIITLKTNLSKLQDCRAIVPRKRKLILDWIYCSGKLVHALSKPCFGYLCCVNVFVQQLVMQMGSLQ
uniref:Uncharacterized protein n=1 Tax=Anguilla anguilla TaxID=7936 RepID=A0A0E9W766_ANGAN